MGGLAKNNIAINLGQSVILPCCLQRYKSVMRSGSGLVFKSLLISGLLNITRSEPFPRIGETKGETKKPPSHLVINWLTHFLFILCGQQITNIWWLWSLRVAVLPLPFTSLRGGGRGGHALLQPITTAAQPVLV